MAQDKAQEKAQEEIAQFLALQMHSMASPADSAAACTATGAASPAAFGADSPAARRATTGASRAESSPVYTATSEEAQHIGFYISCSRCWKWVGKGVMAHEIVTRKLKLPELEADLQQRFHHHLCCTCSVGTVTPTEANAIIKETQVYAFANGK